MWTCSLTLQNVHPDQLGALRPTPDLPLQVVLGLQRKENGTIKTGTHKDLQTIEHLKGKRSNKPKPP